MLKEAIILAGGLGTRLKGVINDIPKPMAPINNVPFLTYLFNYLHQFKIEKIVLEVGYKHEVIKDYYGTEFKGISIEYAIEAEPLGTGGGIANALRYVENSEVFLLNGDTYFNVDLKGLFNHHKLLKADLTLSLKAMQNFNRYGTVELEGARIKAFCEKMKVEKGLINGGIYIIKKSLFQQPQLPEKFSFEEDIMESKVKDLNMQAYISKGYFVDIGIPEDYQKAQNELPNLM